MHYQYGSNHKKSDLVSGMFPVIDKLSLVYWGLTPQINLIVMGIIFHGGLPSCN